MLSCTALDGFNQFEGCGLRTADVNSRAFLVVTTTGCRQVANKYLPRASDSVYQRLPPTPPSPRPSWCEQGRARGCRMHEMGGRCRGVLDETGTHLARRGRRWLAIDAVACGLWSRFLARPVPSSKPTTFAQVALRVFGRM